MSSEQRVEVVVLGSGTSHGVPMIGCDCAVCTSSDPRDSRTRASIYVRSGGESVLIDTSPELRVQCIANGIYTVSAILFTHHHADHVSGLDDVRRFNWLTRDVVRCYGTARTLQGLRAMFRYAFEDAPGSPHSRPALDTVTISDAPFQLGELTVTPIPLLHGPMEVHGFRFGRFAYCTDCSAIPPESFDRLADLDVLILDAVRHQPHPAHFNLQQALEVVHELRPRQTYLTHLSHSFPHADTEAELPTGVNLAYDGLRFEVP